MIFFSPEFHSPVWLSHEPGIWKEEEKVTNQGHIPAREERELRERPTLLAGGGDVKRKSSLRERGVRGGCVR